MKKSVFLMLLLCAGMNVLFAQLTTPQLYSPSNNSTNMDVSQRLCVTKVSGANYYEIELDTTSNFNSPLKQTLNASSYNSSYSYYYTIVNNLLYGTKYYWRARYTNSTDTSSWSAVWNFTTRAVPQLYTPSDNSTNMDVSQRLGVTKLSGTNYYEIELDTTSNFNSPMKQTLDASTYYSSYDYYYTTVGNLLYGTKYYWRARCAHSVDTSGWSAVRNFTTRAVPQLYNPSNNSTNMAVTQQLCVTQLSGSNYYEIELDTTSNFDSPLKQTLNASSYNSSYSYYYTSVSNLLYGTKYYWRARCAHSADTSCWSAVWNFTTRAVPQLYNPSNNSTNMAVTQRLCVTQLSGSNYYEIELDTTYNFDSPLKQTLNASSYNSSYSYYYTSVSNLRYGTKYYWRARCAHSADTTGWSAVWNFTTRAVPQLYSPSNNSTNMAVTQRLCVTQLSGSNYYEIELDTTSNFDSPLKQTLNASSYNSSYSYYYTSVSNLLYGTKYYWRARCAHAADTTGWSAVWNFTTQFTLTTAPTLISPVDGATNVDAQNVTLTWDALANATSYQYQVSTTSDFSNLAASGTTANPYVFMVLPGNATYYWRVRGSDGLGFSPWSVIWHFSAIINCDDPVYTYQYATDCHSYTWQGETYTETGVYYDTLSTLLGCDSIVVLNLTITGPSYGTDVQTACNSYTWIDGNTYTTNNNTATYTLEGGASNGCDSIVVLNLTITGPSYGTDVQTACYFYTWIDGNTYTTNNNTATYTLEGGASNGCDSIVTLDLTIVNAVYGTDVQTACNSYTWIDGNTYTTNNNTATYTLEGGASNGCDSIVTLDLTVNHPVENEADVTACDEYEWNGETLTASGDYTATFTAANGCDSTVTLHLTIFTADYADFAETACGSYTWNDEVYTESGDYVQTFTNAHGCDSTVTLHLTIHPAVTELVEVTLCESDLPYHYINGDIDTTFEVGTPQLSTFNFQLLTQHGCDSTVTLTLTIESCDTNGINENGIVNLTLYPNPTTGMVNVQFTMNNEQSGAGEIQVLDVYGRVLDAVDISDARSASVQTVQIDLSHYATGIYLVRWVNGGKVMAVRKVVKE
jgi:hypothetical protein